MNIASRSRGPGARLLLLAFLTAVTALPGRRVRSGQVVTRGVLLPDGTPLVSTGIMPDVPVEPTIEQVRRGEDPVLDEAIRILTGNR